MRLHSWSMLGITQAKPLFYTTYLRKGEYFSTLIGLLLPQLMWKPYCLHNPQLLQRLHRVGFFSTPSTSQGIRTLATVGRGWFNYLKWRALVGVQNSWKKLKYIWFVSVWTHTLLTRASRDSITSQKAKVFKHTHTNTHMDTQMQCGPLQKNVHTGSCFV